MDTGYSVNITEHSYENLTARERLILKDTSNAISIDEATTEGSIIITPANYAVLDVHNEKATEKDYRKYIIVDISGTKYVTGSSTFWRSFIDIFEEMKGEGEYSIEIMKKPSKNYTGKYFLTCSVV